MRKSSTKPQGATSYKETAFGIIPRDKLLKLEIEGTKRGLDYISQIISKNKNTSITPCQVPLLVHSQFRRSFFYA